jgi:hypothetical protein
MWTQALALGGWTALLTVGESSEIRTLIEEQIPGLVLVPDEGNDGQIYYAIGLDLDASQIPSLIPQPALRYRRILLPAAASLFGLVDGYPLFWSTIALVIVSMGVSSAALHAFLRDRHLPRWAMAGLLLNPGVWLAIRLLTPDTLALSLALVGLAMAGMRKPATAIVLCGLAALAKEPYWLVAGAIGVWFWLEGQRRWAAGFLLLTPLPLGIWTLWVSTRITEAPIEAGNLSLPFLGIIEAASTWPSTPTSDQVYVGFVLLMLAAASVLAWSARNRVLQVLVIPWIVLALVSSEWIWRFGNSVARNNLFLVLMVAVLFAARARSSENLSAPLIGS